MSIKRKLEYIIDHLGCLFSEQDVTKTWREIRGEIPEPSRQIIETRLSRIRTGHNFDKEFEVLEQEVAKVWVLLSD